MNTDDVCCLGLAVDIGKISNQHAVGCKKSKKEVTRVNKLLSEMICNWHIILPNLLKAIARVRYSCSLFVMQV